MCSVLSVGCLIRVRFGFCVFLWLLVFWVWCCFSLAGFLVAEFLLCNLFVVLLVNGFVKCCFFFFWVFCFC